jgi:hypothetical protein
MKSDILIEIFVVLLLASLINLVVLAQRLRRSIQRFTASLQTPPKLKRRDE